MILTIIAFFIAVLFAGLAILIVARRWGEIRLLDPFSIKEEQQRQKREALILKRFNRVRAERFHPVQMVGRQVRRVIADAYKRAFERVQALETFYQNVKSPFASMEPSARDRVRALAIEGRSFLRDQKWADAERVFLEALSIDKMNADAYKGLGQLYLKQKLFSQAKETFEFLLKMKATDDVVYSALAEIAEAEEDETRAEAMRLKAVESSPRQPHRHAELAQYYVGRDDFAKAWPSAKRASDLDSKSVKFLEFSLTIAIRLRDGAEARRRYNRLRLLSEDHAKLQRWREEVEELEANKNKKK